MFLGFGAMKLFGSSEFLLLVEPQPLCRQLIQCLSCDMGQYQVHTSSMATTCHSHGQQTTHLRMEVSTKKATIWVWADTYIFTYFLHMFTYVFTYSVFMLSRARRINLIEPALDPWAESSRCSLPGLPVQNGVDTAYMLR